MSTLTDEVFVKLEEKYSKEKLDFIYNNFFLLIRDILKAQLAASIYISNFGTFFLSANNIKKKIEKYKRMKLDTEELEKLLEFSKEYKTNTKEWKWSFKKVLTE